MAKTLHIDCFNGISGDMTVAALLDLGMPEGALRGIIDSLGLGAQMTVAKVRKNGLSATQVHFASDAPAKHRHLHHVEKIIAGSALSENAKQIALAMFRKLAEAEATVHGIAVEKVHFHEVGAVDSICDFAAVAFGFDWLQVDHVTARPTPTGHGIVRCDHGEMPIPAPATAWLLRGIPQSAGNLEGELTTPTGAAILATLVHAFVDEPALTIDRIGVGAGAKTFPNRPNVLRLLSGTLRESAPVEQDAIWQVETNLDDTTPEILGYTIDRLYESGAVEVFLTPIQMKKNRPGVLLSALTTDEHLTNVEGVLFRETATFGLRKQRLQRSVLRRQAVTVATPFGPVRGKLGWNATSQVFSPEYEDCARIAREVSAPLREIYRAATTAFHDGTGLADPVDDIGDRRSTPIYGCETQGGDPC